MKLKSYYAGTVDAALTLARRDLGPEAILVESRRAPAESRHLGQYEVICASLPAQAAGPPPPAAVPPGGPPFLNSLRLPAVDKLSQEVSELKRYMEQMALTLSKSSAGMATLRSNPALAAAFNRLVAAEVDPALAHDIVSRVAEQEPNQEDATSLVAAEIRKLLRVDASLAGPHAGRTVTALVGPPGAGKTTTLVKLAARYGLATRRPAQILTLDTYRVGAAEQLRSYASILGIGFQVVEGAAGLAPALEEHRQKDWVLIDTPGFGKNDLEEAAEMAQFFAAHPAIDTHLVLPGSLKPDDLRRIVSAYEMFRPSKLLITRVDETGTFGPVLNLVVQTGKPVSFLSSGQQIPDDLEPATIRALVELIVKRECPDEAVNTAVAAA